MQFPPKNCSFAAAGSAVLQPIDRITMICLVTVLSFNVYWIKTWVELESKPEAVVKSNREHEHKKLKIKVETGPGSRLMFRD